MDEWRIEFSEPEEYEQQRLLRRQKRRLAIEQLEALSLEIEQEEQNRIQDESGPPAKKRLKWEIEQEALARIESAARTVSDWEYVIALWDRRDANRERRERYHEVSRSGDDLPIDFGAKEDELRFPDKAGTIFAKQRQKGDFIESIFNCPFEIHELVTEQYMSKALHDLSDDHKEILYYSAVRIYNSLKIAEIRGQSDRNIRKVRNTMLKKIRKKILPYLKKRQEKGLSLTMEEKAFLSEAGHVDHKS